MKEAEALIHDLMDKSVASYLGTAGRAQQKKLEAADALADLLAFIRKLVEAQPAAVAGEAWRPVSEFDYAQVPRMLWVLASGKHYLGRCYWGRGPLAADPFCMDEPMVEAWRYFDSHRRVPAHMAPTHFRELPATPGDTIAAPAAPLVGEPTDEQVAKWAADGAPDTRHLNCLEARRISPAFAICEPCNTGFPERCLYQRPASPAAPAGVPTDLQIRRLWAQFGWSSECPYEFARALLAANSVHLAGCDSSEASGSAIPARPTHVHEAWWLIESTFAPRTLYYNGHTKRTDGTLALSMTDDASKAVRFPDEWAAKYAMAAVLGIKTKEPSWPLEVLKFGYAAAEHIFDYTPRALLAGRDQKAAPLHPSSVHPGPAEVHVALRQLHVALRLLRYGIKPTDEEASGFALALSTLSRADLVHPSSVQAVDGDEPKVTIRKALTLGLQHAKWSRDRSRDPIEQRLNEQDARVIEAALALLPPP